MHTSSPAKSASGGHLIRASQRAAAPPSRRVPAGGWDTIIITARGRRACSSGVGVKGHWQRTPAWAAAGVDRERAATKGVGNREAGSRCVRGVSQTNERGCRARAVAVHGCAGVGLHRLPAVTRQAAADVPQRTCERCRLVLQVNAGADLLLWLRSALVSTLCWRGVASRRSRGRENLNAHVFEGNYRCFYWRGMLRIVAALPWTQWRWWRLRIGWRHHRRIGAWRWRRRGQRKRRV